MGNRSLVFGIILLSFFSLCIATQAALICDMCGKAISGTYYRSPNGHTYCSECKSRYTVCSQCGALTKSPIMVENRAYCADCSVKLDRCGICGKWLTGNYTFYPDLKLKVCAQCERDRPRCQKCGVPIGKPVTIGNTVLCELCAARTEKCRSCGNPLLKEYSYFEGNQDFKYCQECIAAYPHCGDCGAPSGPDGTRLDDGRYLCPDCRRLGLFDIGYVLPIEKRVNAFLENHMGMTIGHKVNLSLQGLTFLKDKAPAHQKELNGLFYRKGERFDIYVLYGQRQKDLVEVLAHELSHAWEAEHDGDRLRLEEQEGFAQWVSYKALKSLGYEEFARLMLEDDDHSVYSDGFRKMLEIEKVGGPKAVFDYIEKRSDSKSD